MALRLYRGENDGVQDSRRVLTWAGAGVFAALAIGAVVILSHGVTGINNLPTGSQQLPPPVTGRHGIYPGQVCLLAGFVTAGALAGMVLNLDASPAGRTLAITRGAFIGGLLLAIGLIPFGLLGAFLNPNGT
jgi:hypothetical protein